MKELKRASRLADPRLEGHFPAIGIRRAVEIASMCLREEPNTRPNSNDLVIGLEYLETLKYNPQKTVNTGGSQDETSSTREQAVAEARQWVERERRRHAAQGTPDDEARGSDN